MPVHEPASTDAPQPSAALEPEELRALLQRTSDSTATPLPVPRRRRALLWATAVVSLAAALGAAAYLLSASPLRSERPPAAASSAAPLVTPEVEPAAEPTSGCCPAGVTATPAVLTEAPDGVMWELFQGVALPVSATDGPSLVDGAVHAGYARTPTGALIADAQIGVRRVVTADLAGLRAVGERQLVDGPGKQAHLRLISTLTDNDAPPAGYGQYVGFRMLTWTPKLAVISLATRARDGQLQVSTDTLRWVSGDWQLELPSDGLQRPQLVTDLSGYVPWSGVS